MIAHFDKLSLLNTVSLEGKEHSEETPFLPFYSLFRTDLKPTVLEASALLALFPITFNA